MFRHLVLCCTAFILSVIADQVPLTDSTPSLRLVDLGYAKYQSDLSLVPGVTSFLGIRYAAPPTAEFRWRKPQRPSFTSEVLNATAHPQQCFHEFMMGAMGSSLKNPHKDLATAPAPLTTSNSHRESSEATIDGMPNVELFLDMNLLPVAVPQTVNSTVPENDEPPTNLHTDGISNEDCLFLNVHVPSKPKGVSLLPVIVYIHGGGYDAGNVSLYPVEDFVRASNFGVVSVSIQYRIGLFGFLAGKSIKEEGDLNAGLLDQNFALQWVQEHITAFGGDSTKVTIWGQSAGAGSVLQHVVAHAGNTQPPLFRAAMMSSPFLPFQYSFDEPIPEALYSKVVSHVNCTGSKDALACLRATPASTLLAADTTIGFGGFLGTYSFVPVVDGSFITERPTSTLKSGRLNGDALLVSSTANEGALFVPPHFFASNNVTLGEYVTHFFPRLNDEQVGSILDIYSTLGESVVEQASAIMGDAIFTCPAYYAAAAFGQQGFKALFALPPATHAQDLSYEFADFGLPPTYHDKDFFNAWQQAFMTMAISLNPNDHSDPGNITPKWPNWSANQDEMIFSKTDSDLPVVTTVPTSSDETCRCVLWDSLSSINAQ